MKKVAGRSRALVFGCALLLIAARPAGPDPWREEVTRALAASEARLAGGAGGAAVTRLGVLLEGRSAVMELPLREGGVYFVVAVCDRDCGRLALDVTDPRRYTLDSDHSETPRPALRITPQVSGVHRIVVSMGRCAVDPCRYGVAVIAR